MFNKIFRKKAIPSSQEQLEEWQKNGRISPPPHIVKQQIIKEYQSKFKLNILVETGTYLGDMVEAMQNNFKQIFSIELSKKLHTRASKKFKPYPHINLLQGDSGKLLSEIVNKISEPALFWLDGHYSGGITAMGDKECPVPEELSAIFGSNYNHIILIDDARLFNGSNDYPTILQIQNIIQASARNYEIVSQDDIIRLTPKNT